jgi:hypothetical protein
MWEYSLSSGWDTGWHNRGNLDEVIEEELGSRPHPRRRRAVRMRANQRVQSLRAT